MKVLWVGDACVSSGFARCTHAACDALHAAGHEVNVLGLNYFGDPHTHPYRVWPCYQPHDHGHDGFGVDRLPHLIARLKPDVVVLQNDPWNIPVYIRAIKEALPSDFKLPPIVAWLAVDAANQRGDLLNDGLTAVATWTEWALRELTGGGYKETTLDVVIPLGVDHELFYEQDRMAARRALGVPESAYIVGVVGRNQIRKRLDLTIKYFSTWVKSCGVENAVLLLHVAPTGERGVDVRNLAIYHGLKGRVFLFEPHIGHGADHETMRSVYAAMDCYFTTTQGEGWGLPALEAMACGVPVIAPDWSGLGDWARGNAYLVPCSAMAISAPLEALAYTIGGIMDEIKAVEALDRVYRQSWVRDDMRHDGLRLAASLPWSYTGKLVVEWLEAVVPDKPKMITIADQQKVADAIQG